MCETLTTTPEILYPYAEPRVCTSCRSLCVDDLEDTQRLFKECIKCDRVYCSHYASKIDLSYCQYCFHDFVFEDTIITKEIKSKSLNGRKVFTRNMKARHLVFKGEAWMFAERRVVTMTDEELHTSIEYHREIFSQMMNERDARQIQKNHLAIKRMVRTSGDLNNPSRDSGSEVGNIIGLKSTTIKTTRVTKTRITAQGGANPVLAMQAIVSMFKAQGLSEQQIQAALAAMLAKAKA